MSWHASNFSSWNILLFQKHGNWQLTTAANCKVYKILVGGLCKQWVCQAIFAASGFHFWRPAASAWYHHIEACSENSQIFQQSHQLFLTPESISHDTVIIHSSSRFWCISSRWVLETTTNIYWCTSPISTTLRWATWWQYCFWQHHGELPPIFLLKYGDHLMAQHFVFVPPTVTHPQRRGFLQHLLDGCFHPMEEANL